MNKEKERGMQTRKEGRKVGKKKRKEREERKEGKQRQKEQGIYAPNF